MKKFSQLALPYIIWSIIILLLPVLLIAFYAITDSVFIQKISELHNIKDIETLKKESENIQNEMDNSQEAISHFFTEYYELQTLVRNFAYFDRIHEIVK